MYPAFPAPTLYRTRQTFERLRKDGLWWGGGLWCGWRGDLHGSLKPHIWRFRFLTHTFDVPVEGDCCKSPARPLAFSPLLRLGTDGQMSHFFC